MAIYSLRLTPIGKTTQRQPFTAAAHLGYIARKEAASHTMAERMPEGKVSAMRWMRAEEKADRVNARVADKLVIALPRELTLQQQITLVWSFAEKLTQGRASWFASIHAKGKDRNNPHCHLLVRDRDIHTRQRVVMFSAGAKEARERAAKGLSAPTTLRGIRAMWEQSANQALKDAGRKERIDRRSLVDQGVPRFAQVHEGPNIRAMHERGFRPESRERVYRNRAVRRRGVPPTRLVRYPEIDRGRTRMEYNAALRPTIRTTFEDRPKVRVGESPRERVPVWAHPPIVVQAAPRSAVSSTPEPMRAEEISSLARLLLEQQEQKRSAVAPAVEPPRTAAPVPEKGRPPVETPEGTEGMPLAARLLREVEARRQATTPASEPPRPMSPIVPKPPTPRQDPVYHQPSRAEGLSPNPRVLKIKAEERERSAAARASEPPRTVPPVVERPRPPVEAPARADEFSLSARLQKMKEEEARRQASEPVSEPPRPMSMTERLRQAKGLQGAQATPMPHRNRDRER